MSKSAPAMPRILISGGTFDTVWLRELARLTGKPRPRVVFLPTAVGDADEVIVRFYARCAPLNVEPIVQKMFIDSLTQTQSFSEVLLGADAIVASGGNTLNQQAIWRAQGVDVLLRRAWRQGVVLGGSSAGALCWFASGSTDSRPQALSIVEGLGLIPTSHCPHYDSESGRRPQYQALVQAGTLPGGYACDDDAGLLFEGRRVARVLRTRDGAGVYRVTRGPRGVREQTLASETFGA